LGAESLTGPKEVWWFNGYQSSTERQQLYEADLTLKPIEVFASYRTDQSDGTPWILGQGRYLVITMTDGASRLAGSVFESTDGTRFVVRSAQTREQADAAKVSAGRDTTVLAIRPSWSFPSAEWIAADPEFWQASPAARR
jgi:hypothetical protein